jgi:hypothetical protein
MRKMVFSRNQGMLMPFAGVPRLFGTPRLTRQRLPNLDCTQSSCKRQKLATQAYNICGHRDAANSIFIGDFMRSNLSDVAVHADKVFPEFLSSGKAFLLLSRVSSSVFLQCSADQYCDGAQANRAACLATNVCCIRRIPL